VQSHILLVDDEISITDNLTPFLKRSGFSVSVASNGEEALEIIAAETINLIVSL
jgi:DNA-binding response OmpR family regulator